MLASSHLRKSGGMTNALNRMRSLSKEIREQKRGGSSLVRSQRESSVEEEHELAQVSHLSKGNEKTF